MSWMRHVKSFKSLPSVIADLYETHVFVFVCVVLFCCVILYSIISYWIFIICMFLVSMRKCRWCTHCRWFEIHQMYLCCFQKLRAGASNENNRTTTTTTQIKVSPGTCLWRSTSFGCSIRCTMTVSGMVWTGITLKLLCVSEDWRGDEVATPCSHTATDLIPIIIFAQKNLSNIPRIVKCKLQYSLWLVCCNSTILRVRTV